MSGASWVAMEAGLLSHIDHVFAPAGISDKVSLMHEAKGGW
jgi:hypothetical protein